MSDFASAKQTQISHPNLPKASKFNNLPSFAKAGFTHFEKYQNVRKQAFLQTIAVCELLKAKANNIYLDGKYASAVVEYEQALSIYRYICLKNSNMKHQNIKDEDLEFVDVKGQNEEEKSKITEMKVALYNNLAACYLKLKDFPNAIAACGEALTLDKTQAKAWYRRAKATISKNDPKLPEYSQARDDLKVAFELAPHESTIEELYLKVLEEIGKYDGDKKGSSEGGLHPKEKIDKKSEEIKSTEKVKKSSDVPKGNKTEEIKSDLNKAQAQEKTKNLNPKEQQEEKIETQSTAPDNPSEQESKTKYPNKIENDNDVWKMLHGDADPNAQNFSYELSFEINPNAKVPKEIREFGLYLENRAKELIALYEKSGRRKDIPQLRENLKQVMDNHRRIENISRLDFSRPGPKLRETAKKLNLDLNDPSIKTELLKMQEQNLEDVRKMLKSEKIGQPQPVQNESRYEKLRWRKASKGSARKSSGAAPQASSNANTTINNYFINNNYFGEKSFFSRFFSSDEANTGSTPKDPQSKLRDSTPVKGQTILKWAFYGLIFFFFVYLLIIDQSKQFQKEGDPQNQEV